LEHHGERSAKRQAGDDGQACEIFKSPSAQDFI
jgi:hypothetical protein